MITPEDYFGRKPHSPAHAAAADDLLERANALIAEARAAGVNAAPVCPHTGSEISGSAHGAGDGGFRLSTSTTGVQTSAHKEARAVDVYDPIDALDAWLDLFESENGANSKLEQHGLYREHPEATHGWCHLGTRPPKSGRRTFHP